MPKKPKGGKASKKMKEIKKFVEDKTFGMKNKKKSKKIGNFVKQLAGGEKGGYEKMQAEIYKEKEKKKKLMEERKLLVNVFAKNAKKKGEEICQYFKAGLCKKGKKCQFSHNVSTTVTHSNKLDIYTDQRVAMFGNKDTIDDWNQEKLNEAVNYNEKKYNAVNKTEKICKNFLEAVEKKKYGWFWVCPNGYNCIYRHCLPPDYVFKSDKKVVEEKKVDDLAQKIDAERDKLDGKKLTPVTKELFDKWLKKRRERLEKARKERINAELKSMGFNIKKKATGRELFEKDNKIFKDDEGAVGEYEREEQVDVDEDVFGDEELPDV